MKPEIEIEASTGEGMVLPIATAEAEDVVRHVLEAERITAAEISVAFLGDEEIAALNREYLSHDGATDVISFTLDSARERPLGDVYIGVRQAERQAEELGVPVHEELLRLTVHGTLHVLGYDHPADADRDRSPMYLRQEELLQSFLGRISADRR